MKKIKILSLIALLMMGLVTACDPDEDDKVDCTGVVAANNTYTNSVKAIVDISCALSGCHDATTKEHDIDMSTFVGTKAAFQGHEVLCSINHSTGCDPMPQGLTKLSDANIQKLSCWAQNGYTE